MHTELTSVFWEDQGAKNLRLTCFSSLIWSPILSLVKCAPRRLFVILCSQKLGLWQGVQVESSSASCTCEKEHGECMTTFMQTPCLFYFATHASCWPRHSSFCTTIIDCRLRAGLHYGGEVHWSWKKGCFSIVIGWKCNSWPVGVYTRWRTQWWWTFLMDDKMTWPPYMAALFGARLVRRRPGVSCPASRGRRSPIQ